MSPHVPRRLISFLVLAVTATVTSGALAQQSSGVVDSQSTWQVADSQQWTLRHPDAMQSPVFRGLASHDRGGGAAGGLLYPGTNAGGFLVAILTHAVINESVKSSQRSALQQEADKVLAPYKPVLDGWRSDDLLHRTVAEIRRGSLALSERLAAAGAQPTHWVVESAPLFSMTQDRRALMVEAEVTVRLTDAQQVAHKSSVKIVGQPISESGAQDHWNTDGGERLKSESAVLHAQAIGLAMEDMLGMRAGKDRQRTIRYALGGEEVIERAQVLGRRCGSLVIRSLRGDLSSVPLSNAMANVTEETRPCEGSAKANAPGVEPSASTSKVAERN
jgi:hypothetical protein